MHAGRRASACVSVPPTSVPILESDGEEAPYVLMIVNAVTQPVENLYSKLHMIRNVGNFTYADQSRMRELNRVTLKTPYVYSIHNTRIAEIHCISIDGRYGVVVGILAYYSRGRGLDSRTVQTFVFMNMSVCIGSGCFYV
jgi:hypothetical protein